MAKLILGRKEKDLLAYLYDKKKVWLIDLMKEFAVYKRYRRYLFIRLLRLEKRQLVKITVEKCPETGRNRKAVTLTDFGKKVVERQLLNQS